METKPNVEMLKLIVNNLTFSFSTDIFANKGVFFLNQGAVKIQQVYCNRTNDSSQI